MEITTKLAPGEKGWVLHDNKAHECQAIHFKVDSRLKKGSKTMVEVDTAYTIVIKGREDEGTLNNIPEDRIFRTKDELLKSL